MRHVKFWTCVALVFLVASALAHVAAYLLNGKDALTDVVLECSKYQFIAGVVSGMLVMCMVHDYLDGGDK